jgi:polyisoprenyl-phosphate glycosyltransferase
MRLDQLNGVTAMIPCYDEVECIDRCYQEVRKELSRYSPREILFIDDGSSDGTLERIKKFAENDPQVNYISFSRNFGLEAAFSAGFRYASMPWTVQLDADLQSVPAEMHKLINVAQDGFDVVFAIRKNRADPWFRRAGTAAHQWVATGLLGIELPVGASVFRVARTSVARKVIESRLSTPYFLATAPLLGARYTVVETEHSPRQGGTGKWRLKHLSAHAVELFVGFSFRPLTACYHLTIALALISIVGVASAGFGGYGEQWWGAVAELASMVGLLLLAVVARYLIRVMRVQTSGWANYQIRETNLEVSANDHLYGLEDNFR